MKRLISRDRKEFLGNDEDILDKYTTEFGETSATSTASTSKGACAVALAVVLEGPWRSEVVGAVASMLRPLQLRQPTLSRAGLTVTILSDRRPQARLLAAVQHPSPHVQPWSLLASSQTCHLTPL